MIQRNRINNTVTTFHMGSPGISINGQSANVTVFENSPNSVQGTSVRNLSVKNLVFSGKSANETSRRTLKSDAYCVKTGIVLIINQKEFYINDEEKMLRKPNEKLSVREGTNHDRDKLRKTFSARRFKVVEKENLTAEQIVAAIKKVVRKCNKFDSLIVCILSHGEEGVIYDSDSIPVTLTSIKDLMALSETVRNKPKVLIVQACQGTVLLPIDLNLTKSYVERDAIPNGNGRKYSSSIVPIYCDFCTAIATIPRFAAIRDKESGSWFIQTLCEMIEREGDDKDFNEIVTLVIDDIKKRRVRYDECMVPEQISSFSKKLYLPPLK